MGMAILFESEGLDGGTWYAVQYPLGATKYYSTTDAREVALTAYERAIESTGGYVFRISADDYREQANR